MTLTYTFACESAPPRVPLQALIIKGSRDFGPWRFLGAAREALFIKGWRGY
jgi:hypothetical protein